MTRLLLALDNWRRRASEASLGLPLGILAVTAIFWLVVWLADHALQGSISPVGVLVRIYGTGAFVMLTLLMVAIAVWMIVQRLGYRDVFFDGTGDSTEKRTPAQKWDSSIPDFTGQITKLVSSMDAPASPLPAMAPAASPAGGGNGRKAAPASAPKTASQPEEPAAAPEPETMKSEASPAADTRASAKSAAPSPERSAASSPAGKSAMGKSAAGKKAQTKSCASKPLLKRKGRK